MLAAVVALLVLQLIAEPMVNRSVPVWMAVEPGLPLFMLTATNKGRRARCCGPPPPS